MAEETPQQMAQRIKPTMLEMFANIKNKLTGSNSLQGASTITQQLVKNLILTNERTFERKIKEIILSIIITKELSKQEILELYLNYIFFGNNYQHLAILGKPLGCVPRVA